MNKWTQLLLVILNVLCFCGVLALLLKPNHLQSGAEGWREELEMAALLRDKGLYEQSARAYEGALSLGILDPGKRSNVRYLLGTMYMDQLDRWEDALGCFYEAKETGRLDEKTEREADRRIVECLERLDRSRSARLELERTTVSDGGIPLEKAGGGQICARIGSRNINQAEVYKAFRDGLGRNPEDAREEEIEAFLQQYVAREVLSNAAIRKGLSQNKEVMKRVHAAKKNIMIEAFLREELGDIASPSPEELRGYYETNKELFADEDGTCRAFEEVKEQVWSQLMLAKEQGRTAELLQRLMKAEDAIIFGHAEGRDG